MAKQVKFKRAFFGANSTRYRPDQWYDYNEGMFNIVVGTDEEGNEFEKLVIPPDIETRDAPAAPEVEEVIEEQEAETSETDPTGEAPEGEEGQGQDVGPEPDSNSADEGESDLPEGL